VVRFSAPVCYLYTAARTGTSISLWLPDGRHLFCRLLLLDLRRHVHLRSSVDGGSGRHFCAVCVVVHPLYRTIHGVGRRVGAMAAAGGSDFSVSLGGIGMGPVDSAVWGFSVEPVGV